jgi:hypothetical protein
MENTKQTKTNRHGLSVRIAFLLHGAEPVGLKRYLGQWLLGRQRRTSTLWAFQTAIAPTCIVEKNAPTRPLIFLFFEISLLGLTLPTFHFFGRKLETEKLMNHPRPPPGELVIDLMRKVHNKVPGAEESY